AAPSGPESGVITFERASPAGDLTLDYRDIPQPDDDGVFEIDGVQRLVVATASTAALDTAAIQCVGEQLYDYIEARLGEAPEALPWDEALARAWLPLDRWLRTFLITQRFAQPLDQTNWLARWEHLRSLYMRQREQVLLPTQRGRVCLFQKPEGPNLRHIRRLAMGADIQQGQLVIVDDQPAARLSV